MLSVPTLWTSFLTVFVALAIVWAYVVRSYPTMAAARYWLLGSLFGALGTAISMLRFVEPVAISVVVSSTLFILCAWTFYNGVRRFYGLPVSWIPAITATVLVAAALTFFAVVVDSMQIRVVIYSLVQAIPGLLIFRVLRIRKIRDHIVGARLAVYVAVATVFIMVFRSIAVSLNIGGVVTVLDFNGLQAVILLLLIFIALAVNFGFVLMSIDRLREDVAELALVDDLTGVANRRGFLQKLKSVCARASETQRPLSLIAMDLDGFKETNDTFGHAAGDACLQHFALMVQSRLRPDDILARVGGDEFTILLPDTPMSEAVKVAQSILETCRADAVSGNDIAVASSIGLAQWNERFAVHPERFLNAADRALYRAKQAGRNRYACDDEPAPLEAALLSPV